MSRRGRDQLGAVDVQYNAHLCMPRCRCLTVRCHACTTLTGSRGDTVSVRRRRGTLVDCVVCHNERVIRLKLEAECL